MKALVTGGGGFLGSAIVRLLRQRGEAVVSFSRNHYPHLEAMGVEQVQADLTEPDRLRKAAVGCDVIFHVAAKAGVWGPADEYEAVNVQGTRHVLLAAEKEGVRHLVFTSSPSVVFSGNDEGGADEYTPYPERFLAAYPRTKAQAEQMILAANRPGSLRTVALRPHLIWGPGDPHLVPRIIERAKRGKLRLVGRGENLVDATYIDNAALAHILAADRLMNDDKPKCAGKAYFIANGEPLPMRELINRILAAAGLPAVKRRVPPRLAFAVGSLMETLKRNDSPKEPLMTRFVARQLATSHWYLLGAARRDLGYKPQVNLEEGMQRLAGWLQGQVESTTPASP